MKKLLSSALLCGLLLGAMSPVSATTVDNSNPEGTTPIESNVVTSYTVSIPSTLTIAHEGNVFTSSTGDVTLTNLSVFGQVDVVATTTDLTLEGHTGDEAVLTTVLNGGEYVSDESRQQTTFSLKDNDLERTQVIEVLTEESSKENLPGKYTGTVTYSFTYNDTIIAE